MYKVCKSGPKKRTKQRKSRSIGTKSHENGVEESEKVQNSIGPYGFSADGKKKRILLNAFDMNGIRHTRYGISNQVHTVFR
jgi:hypothetical protein